MRLRNCLAVMFKNSLVRIRARAVMGLRCKKRVKGPKEKEK